MTRSPAHDLALYLVSQGASPALGGNSKWAMSVGAEPDKPEDTVTLYDTGGGELDTDELDIATPSFQVRVKAKSYQEGYDKQAEIRRMLIANPILECEASVFDLILPSSDILSLGKNDRGLSLLTVNYRSRRTEKGA